MNSFNSRILKEIEDKQSHLCVGLDINPENFDNANPSIDDLKNHTYKVIDATRDIAVAYKPNLAFFERWGSKGFQWLEETMEYIGSDVITVGDAKRGDIGNTAKQYAMSLFDHFGFDSVTLSPFLGLDSIKPIVDNPNKGAFILCRTSNSSATFDSSSSSLKFSSFAYGKGSALIYRSFDCFQYLNVSKLTILIIKND